MRKIKAIMLAICLALAASAAAALAQEKISRPLEYKGYTSKAYSDYERISKYVEMSDGVKLAVDIYLPRKGPEKKSFPVVVEYTPYSRAFANAGFKPLEKTNAKNMLGGRGAIVPMPFCFDMGLIERGYALVIADIRGSGASFGSRIDLSPQIGKDGAELIEWIAAQEWCDGNIGMKGGSYMAISQILTAANKPEHLKCIFLMVYPFGYHDLYAGGIFNRGFMDSFSDLLWTMNMNEAKNAGGFPVMPSAPVIDEDGDGEILDEIPLDLNKNGSFTDDYRFPEDPADQPQYSDGVARKHIYFLATKDHAKNIKIRDWVSAAKFIDSSASDIGIADRFGNFDGYSISPISKIPQIMESGIPVYHVGGWFDAQTRSTAIFYATAKKTNPSKLLMLPVYHIIMSPYLKYFKDNPDMPSRGIKTETLRFFDRYLKGVDNGIDREPPVALYVMGKGMRVENEWPPQRARDTKFFFTEGNAMSAAAGSGGKDVFRASLKHDSSFGSGKGNRWKMYVMLDNVPDRAEQDKLAMTYTTAPLESDVEVTGHPVIDIWVSSTAADGDFFVYVSDVAEDGKAVLVTEQPMRAGFAGLKDINKMISRGETGTEVLPKLPWHGYEKTDYNPAVFAGGRIVNLKFDLQPTSWVFKKGHSIRVSIAAADWPTFPLNPAVSPDDDPASPAAAAPDITFYRDAERPSGIILPIVAE